MNDRFGWVSEKPNGWQAPKRVEADPIKPDQIAGVTSVEIDNQKWFRQDMLIVDIAVSNLNYAQINQVNFAVSAFSLSDN